MAISGGTTWLLLKHRGMSQEKKKDKRGSNNHEEWEGFSAIWSLTTTDRRGFLPSDPSPRQTGEGFLPSDPSPRLTRGFLSSDPSPRQTRGFCHQILHYGPYADGLPWDCYLRPATSSQTYSEASSWTHPVPAPSHCPRPASLLLPFGLGPSERRAKGLLPDPGCDYPRFTHFFLLSIFSITHLPFPITPVRNSVCPSLSPSPLLRFVINWLDQHLDHCFLISRRIYIFQRTSSPCYKLEQDKVLTKIFFHRPPPKLPVNKVFATYFSF